MEKDKAKSAAERFTDAIPFEVIETQEDNVGFQEGFRAAKEGEPRNESKGLDWVLGYDEYLKKQKV